MRNSPTDSVDIITMNKRIQPAKECLTAFFCEHPKVALAFSGGVDSSYLLCAAVASGAAVCAYYARTPFQPAFEQRDAIRVADHLGAKLVFIDLDVLESESVASNPKDRCYACKAQIFSAILKRACGDGYDVLIDGTNASDDAGDRPGMRAIFELGVLSPLRSCGMTKADVRLFSKQAGLFTWDKPAYACLATRIPAGEPITVDKLQHIERAEDYLMTLGFTDVRVRTERNRARIELPEAQIPMFHEQKDGILAELEKYFDSVQPAPGVR